MNSYNNLFTKIAALDNLKLAHINASKSKGHYIQIKEFNKDIDNNLLSIQNMLINKTYKDIVYHKEIRNDKGKERILMKLDYYPHRIIQWAIMLICEPIFSKYFCSHSCASIKNKGISKAINLLKKYIYNDKNGTKYCLKIDVKQFYPSINKDILYELLTKKFRDKDLLWLFKVIIDSYPELTGIPIGSYLSQYFANYYLSQFDHWLKENKRIKYVVRYMDDIVILHKNKQYLKDLRIEIEQYWDDNLKLKMKENHQIFPIDKRGVDFVGYVVYPTYTKLRPRNRDSLRNKVKGIRKKIKKGYRLNRNDFASLNSRVGFMKYCHHNGLFKTYIDPYKLDLVRYYNFNINKKQKYLKTLKYEEKLNKKRFNQKDRVKILSASKEAETEEIIV